MIRAVLGLVLALGTLMSLPSHANAAKPACDGEAPSVVIAQANCEVDEEEAVNLLKSPAGPPRTGSWTEHKYEYDCTYKRNAVDDGSPCAPCPEELADRYTILSRQVTNGAPTSGWAPVASVCLTDSDLGDVQRVEITPGMAATEFRRLSWPKAPLTLQPGEGMTLVNMVTTAYSENAGPQTRSVTLLGQQVEVEATPDSWSWHWGDGAAATTTHPGEPAPRGDVTHAYERASDEVRVRVDITYRGRFRVNGGGWQDIPDTATVRGDATPLEVREAVVQLVR